MRTPVIALAASWAVMAMPGCAPRDCVDGLEPGDHFVLHIVEPYVSGSHYTYVQPTGSLPACPTTVGDLASGDDLHMEIVRRVASSGHCVPMVAETTVRGVAAIDPGTNIVGPIETQGTLESGCNNPWRLVIRPNVAHPLGVTAVEGQLPPLIVERTITAASGTCTSIPTCEDFFVAELSSN